MWTETDDGKDTPRGLAAAGCDHQAHRGADLPQEPDARSRILRIRRPIDQVRRRNNLTGNAHAHRPCRSVRHNGAAMPGGETARTCPVVAERPVLPPHVILGHERRPGMQPELPYEEFR